MTVYRVTLAPIDPLLFGDNRPARAGADHLQRDQDPSPVTMHGAVGRFVVDRLGRWPSAWPAAQLGEPGDILQMSEKNVARLLGWCLRDGDGRRWYPRPLHSRVGKDVHGRWFDLGLLAPFAVSGKTSCPFERVLLSDPHEDEVESEMFASDELLAGALGGGHWAIGREAPLANDVRGPEQLYRLESRPGIGMDPDTGLTREGLLFSRPYRRFPPPEDRGGPAVVFEAWFEPQAPLPEWKRALGFLGGDRGRAHFRFEAMAANDTPLSAIRERVVRSVSEAGGFLIYLLTPLIQGEPPEVAGQRPVAAAIGRRRASSGWDVRAGTPRPLATLVPAGSVYFYDWPLGADEATRASLIRQHWLASVSRLGAAAGFGRILVGVWGSQ